MLELRELQGVYLHSVIVHAGHKHSGHFDVTIGGRK